MTGHPKRIQARTSTVAAGTASQPSAQPPRRDTGERGDDRQRQVEPEVGVLPDPGRAERVPCQEHRRDGDPGRQREPAPRGEHGVDPRRERDPDERPRRRRRWPEHRAGADVPEDVEQGGRTREQQDAAADCRGGERHEDAAPPASGVPGQEDERHRRHQHPRAGMNACRLGEQQSRGNEKRSGAPPATRFHLAQGDQHRGAPGRAEEGDRREVGLRRAHADRDRIDRQEQCGDEGGARREPRHATDREREWSHQRREQRVAREDRPVRARRREGGDRAEDLAVARTIRRDVPRVARGTGDEPCAVTVDVQRPPRAEREPQDEGDRRDGRTPARSRSAAATAGPTAPRRAARPMPARSRRRRSPVGATARRRAAPPDRSRRARHRRAPAPVNGGGRAAPARPGSNRTACHACRAAFRATREERRSRPLAVAPRPAPANRRRAIGSYRRGVP